MKENKMVAREIIFKEYSKGYKVYEVISNIYGNTDLLKE
jgi:hypothetical protein